jgi:predicted exporter
MSQRGRITLLVLWLLVLAGLGWMVSQRLKVSTDLRSFMPAPTTADQRLLMAQVGDGAGSRLLLLAISGQPDAKLAALSQGLVAALKKDPRYSQVLNGGFDLGALDPKLLPYRYLLSPTLDTQPLDEAYLADQLQQRLDDLSSPGASLLKDLLPRDPTSCATAYGFRRSTRRCWWCRPPPPVSIPTRRPRPLAASSRRFMPCPAAPARIWTSAGRATSAW